MPSRFRLLWVPFALLPFIGCQRPPEERAFEACRAEVGQRLLEPATARYERIRLERRRGDGANVVDGWDVEVKVEARAGDKRIARSRVLCTLGMDYELLDLSGEQETAER
jgi:hypothetical protein